MSNTYEIYLVSDSTGETLDRIFLAIKAQFDKIQFKTHQRKTNKQTSKQNKRQRKTICNVKQLQRKNNCNARPPPA